MRKQKLYLLIILFTFIFSFVNAVNDKFLVGGTIGFGYINTKGKASNNLLVDSKTIYFSKSPIFGYQISDNFMIGLAVEFNLENTYTENQIYENIKQNDLLVTPFVRYYVNSPLYFQGQFNIGSSIYKTKGTMITNGYPFSMDSKIKYSVLGIGLGVGYDIKLADRIKLEPMIRYLFNSYNDKEYNNDYTNSNVVFNLGLVFNF